MRSLPFAPAASIGLAVLMAVAGWRVSRPAETSQDGGRTAPVVTTAKPDFSGIILPDLLVVLPSGLSSGEVSRLRAVDGVRKVIAFDGAQITVGGDTASVIGVNPSQFRSWVPLRTASDERLWAKLGSGSFLAASTAERQLRLLAGTSYELTGATALSAPFGGAARLGIAGVDLVVNQAVSRKLGLVHQVAALISAPGPSLATLTAKVTKILGTGVKLVPLRGHGTVADQHTSAAQITNYLQLFQASAAKYCPAMSWTVLAAIGQIESADGQNVGPSSAGALGPMQFLPSTWSEWGIVGFGPAGAPDIMDPFDAVPSAARMLCADGASSGTQAGLRQAIFAYNHADWYVNEVLALATQYAAEYR